MTAATVIPFRFESHEVRTVIVDDEPWFIAKDVCVTLGINNSRQALEKIPAEHKGVIPIDTLGGVQQMNAVDEPGLYRLILRSDKPQAEPFMEWVTSEVLLAIRKTGCYRQPGAAQFQNKPESFILIAREFRATLRLARAMGLKGTHAVHAASRLTGDLTGFEPLALFDAADFAEPDGNGAAPRRK